MFQRFVLAGLAACCFVSLPLRPVHADDDPTYGRPPSPDCILLVPLHKAMPKKEYQRYVYERTKEGWTLERGVTAGAGHFGRIWLCPPPSQPTGVQAIPVLPFGFEFGFGHRDRGGDEDRLPRR